MRKGLLLLLLAACSGDDGEESGDETGVEDTGTEDTGTDGPCPELPCDALSDYGLFVGPLADLTLADDVHPYEPMSPLWSDNAAKDRFFRLPEGETVGFGADETWDWPEGAILGKHFRFPADLRDPESPSEHVETRLLIREDGEWTAHVYLWREDQSEADRYVAGRRVDVTYIDLEGVEGTHEYIVPNTNQCKNCHGRDDVNHSLGAVTPQLNGTVVRDGSEVNQLQWLAERGVFSEDLPDPSTLRAFVGWEHEDLDAAARGYLHANCAHCHRPGSTAGSSGLDLLAWTEDPKSFGVCKEPAAAGSGTGGRDYDIYPGSPDKSIIPFRMASTDPDVKMPELPQLIPHERGIGLISDWITSLDLPPCD